MLQNTTKTGKKPLVAKVKFIVWDCPTSVSLGLPHQKTYTLALDFLASKGVFKIRKDGYVGGVDGFNYDRFGEALMHLLIGECGHAIKQIKYEVVDWGDCPVGKEGNG